MPEYLDRSSLGSLVWIVGKNFKKIKKREKISKDYLNWRDCVKVLMFRPDTVKITLLPNSYSHIISWVGREQKESSSPTPCSLQYYLN